MKRNFLNPTVFHSSLLRIATYFITFLIFFALVVFLGFLVNVRITPYTLPVVFLLYVIGVAIISKRMWPSEFRQHIVSLSIFIIISIGIFFAGIMIFSHTHDTSYDGQAYHQTAIISFIHGWNPLYDTNLPLGTLQGSPYVKGYPKLFWELYAAFSLSANNLNAATALNLVPVVIAILSVLYCCLVTIRLGKWSYVITVLAVSSIYLVQQLFTFMADGISYEIGLASLALLVSILASQKLNYYLVVPFFGLLTILLAIKFNNALVVLAEILIFLGYIYKTRTFLSRKFWKVAGISIVVAFMVLVSPFIINYLREKSFIYPQNLDEPQATLRSGNIPPNITNSGPIVQLFYGIFAKAQPARAGDPKSPENVANLKLPYSFTAEEFEAAADFLGRVASPGPLFGGAVVSSIVLLGYIGIIGRKYPQDKRVIKIVLYFVGLIVLLGLLNPVPNKLRYAPFITLLPIIVIIGSLRITHARQWLPRIMRLIIAGTVAINIGVASIFIIQQRQSDFASIESQRIELQKTSQPIRLISTSFNSVGYQLNAHGIAYTMVNKCPAGQSKGPIILAFQTAFYCKVN